MNWRPTIYWGALAVLVGIVAIVLTHWISVVNLNSDRPLGFIFSGPQLEIPAPEKLFALRGTPLRRKLPRIVINGYNELVLVVPGTIRGVHILGYTPAQFSCVAITQPATGQASVAAIIQALRHFPLTPVSVTPGTDIALKGEAKQIATTNGLAQDLAVTDVGLPLSVSKAIRGNADRSAVIRCDFKEPLAASPTFTDRSITLVTSGKGTSAALLDISALSDIQDLRFFGGNVLPWEGNRTRLFDHNDQVVSAEWSDVAAQARRDMLLVVIGALAAIAASTGLEAVRPIVEHLTHTVY